MNTPTADDVLAKLGLQTRMSTRDYMVPALGIFGLGILVGAGIVVMSTPRMRDQLRDRLRRGASKMRDIGEQAREKMEDAAEQIKEKVSGGNGRGSQQAGEDFQGMTRDQLLEQAKARSVQTRPNMTKAELIEALNAPMGH
jgi:hypothetical protein